MSFLCQLEIEIFFCMMTLTVDVLKYNNADKLEIFDSGSDSNWRLINISGWMMDNWVLMKDYRIIPKYLVWLHSINRKTNRIQLNVSALPCTPRWVYLVSWLAGPVSLWVSVWPRYDRLCPPLQPLSCPPSPCTAPSTAAASRWFCSLGCSAWRWAAWHCKHCEMSLRGKGCLKLIKSTLSRGSLDNITTLN